MCAVFRPSQDGESENPCVTESTGCALTSKGISLVTFFVPAKKVTRQRRKPCSWKQVAKSLDPCFCREERKVRGSRLRRDDEPGNDTQNHVNPAFAARYLARNRTSASTLPRYGGLIQSLAAQRDCRNTGS